MARWAFLGCECGARMVYGFGPGEVGHSRWCPWSTDLVVVPWFCENSGCPEGTAVAAVERNTQIHYFCKRCWDLTDELLKDPTSLIYTYTKHWSVTPSPRE